MKHWLRANKGFLAFLLLFGVFRTAVADWNPIPSGSMRPNLLEGDVVFVNRLAFDVKVPLTSISLARTGEPQRGDIVTFYSPQDGTHLIKRLVGLPGDVVELRDDHLIINGQPAIYADLGVAREPVVHAGTLDAARQRETIDGFSHSIQMLPTLPARRDMAPVTIGPDEFLMLGDNRDNSADSRYIGLVPRRLLIGRAVGVLVSADMLGNWHPRFERFGMSLAR